jgi:hypothetical protein
MTYSPDVYYGGARAVEYSLSTTSYTILNEDYARVWYLINPVDDIQFETIDFVLPDPRPNLLDGWMYYVVFNNTSNDGIRIMNNSGNILEILPRDTAALIGLREHDTQQGKWTIKLKSPAQRGFADQGAQDMVSFGASTPANADVFRYTYDTDGWVSGTDSPVATLIVTAGSVHRGSPLAYEAFYLTGTTMFGYANDVHTARNSPSFAGGYTGLVQVDDGIPEGLISFPPSAPNVETFAIDSNTWSSFASFPISTYDDNTVTHQAGLPYIMLGKRTNQAALDNFWTVNTSTTTYFVLSNLPAPTPRWACCLVSMDNSDIHCFNGNSTQDGLAVYSSEQHWQHRGFAGRSWANQPLSIVKAQGQGVNPVDSIPNRVTFGMGNDATGSSPGHYQYNSATLAYSVRGGLVWGPRTRRENAWCGYQR